jgi:hypothetical protein
MSFFILLYFKFVDSDGLQHFGSLVNYYLSDNACLEKSQLSPGFLPLAPFGGVPVLHGNILGLQHLFLSNLYTICLRLSISLNKQKLKDAFPTTLCNCLSVTDVK